jgi:hypothetical protein
MTQGNYPSREELLAAHARKKRKYWLWFFAFTGVVITVQVLFTRSQEERQKELIERLTSPPDTVALRQELIKRQFSSWDGSHINLEKFVKKNMHDPDSYEHVETKYSDSGNKLIVELTYRGKNVFGAKVLNSIKAEVSLYGEVINVLE